MKMKCFERGEEMEKYLSSKNILAEIGARIKAYRIDYPLTQAELAEKSGIAIKSISRMENGEDIQFSNLIKVLIALELEMNLDMLVPDPTKRPSYYINKKETIKLKQRARRTKLKEIKKEVIWGDEKKL